MTNPNGLNSAQLGDILALLVNANEQQLMAIRRECAAELTRRKRQTKLLIGGAQ